MAARVALASLGPVGWVIGAGVGVILGANSDPE